MSIEAFTPSPELYVQVRAAFVGQNTTLNAWCSKHGIGRRNAEAALKGMWNGPKGKALRARIIKASGMVIPSSSESEDHSSPVRPATTGAPEFFYWGC